MQLSSLTKTGAKGQLPGSVCLPGCDRTLLSALTKPFRSAGTMNLNDVMKWTFTVCSCALPVCDDSMSCVHGCTRLCLILCILIRKNTMAARPAPPELNPFIHVGREQMAELRGGGCFQKSALSKCGFFLLFEWKNKTVKYCFNHEQRSNYLTKCPYMTPHTIQGARGSKHTYRSFCA